MGRSRVTDRLVCNGSTLCAIVGHGLVRVSMVDAS